MTVALPAATADATPTLRARTEGTPPDAALESLADYLLEIIQRDAPRRPVLAIVEGSGRRLD